MVRRQDGFSLVEFVIIVVVSGVAIAALVPALGTSLQRHADLQRATLAEELVADMLEEIRATAFEDPQLAAGSFGAEEASRAQYDDCDDYNGLTDSPPRDKTGVALSGYPGFTRSVVVENVAESSFDGPAQTPGSTRTKRITVTVTGSGCKVVVKTIMVRP